MKIHYHLPVLLLSLCTACRPTADDVPAESEANAEVGREILAAEWQAEYNEMTASLPLSPAEQDALRTAFENMQSDLTAWLEGEEGDRLVEHEGRIADAARANDLSGVRSAISEATPLRESFRTQIASHRQNLLNALSPANRAQWEALQLANHLIELMEPLNLRQDQIAAIQTNAGPGLQRAKGRGEPNPSASAFLELEQWAESNVLDAQQRQAYDAVKADNPMRSLSL